MHSVSALGTSAAFSSTMAEGISQTSQVQTSSALASQSASQVLSATVQAVFSDTIAQMSSSPSQAAQLSLTETRDVAAKSDEKKSESAEKTEKTEKTGKVVPSEKRDQIVGYASQEIVKIIQQNASTLVVQLLQLQNPTSFAHETIAVLQASSSLSPEERAVTKWVANFLEQQFKASIPLRGSKFESIMKLLSTKLVQAKAEELCARMQAISADWVDNLVLDTKAGTVV